MKKVFVFCLSILLLTSMGGTMGFAQTTSGGHEFQSAQEATSYIYQNVLFKSMRLEGENHNWHVSLEVSRRFNQNAEYQPYIDVTMTPKNSDIERVTYSIITSQGYLSDTVWQLFTNPIKITSYAFKPQIDESIFVCIKSAASSNMDVLALKSVMPQNLKVSPEQAIGVFVEEYYNIFGKYPQDNFTYELELYNITDWLVAFEDNDNIGGWSVLFVDGSSGNTGGMKMEE